MNQPPVDDSGDRRETDRRARPWLGVVLPVVWLSLGLLGGYLVISLVGSGDDAPPAAETSQGPTATQRGSDRESTKPTPKPKRTTKPTPKAEPTTEPTTEATTQPPVTRSVPVSVYNQVGIGGLARRVAGQAQALGWPIGAVADWRGSVPQDTVYFPAGRQGEAQLLGSDLGISRILPTVGNMSATNLTVVLASPR